jgi:hypothetical protein
MKRARFPEDSSGMVEGPDGPLRRTRANTIRGFMEPVEAVTSHRGGRNQAWLDEEGAWLNAHFLED